MAAEGGRLDFMFLAPPLPGRWIRYCVMYTIFQVISNIISMFFLILETVKCDVTTMRSELEMREFWA